MGVFAEVGSSVLLFFLVFGMSATVEVKSLKKAVRNRNAILTGISLQFLILPLLGFLTVKILNLAPTLGITLLVITSSPGGSYSNWWCSLFNAELALSVTMTTISTLLSVIMLPVNLVLYTSTSYSSAVVKSLDFYALFWSLITVIGGIACGLICSWKIHSHKFNRIANKLGNVAGVSLITFSAVVSSGDHNAQIWDQSWEFYVGIALPCFIGLVIASIMASYFKLDKPERVAVAVECCYQNTGIATSVAINMFEGDDLATAVSVPLFYGIVEAGLLAFYCVGMWKAGWTKAPADESFCVVIGTSYEVRDAELHDPEAIEIVLGTDKEDGPSDLIFTASGEGYQIDEESLHANTNGAASGHGKLNVEEGESDCGLGDTEDPLDETDEFYGDEEEGPAVSEGGASSGLKKDGEEVDLHQGNETKRRKKYSPLNVASPENRRTAVSSDIVEKIPQLEGMSDGRSVSSSGSNPLGRAVASITTRKRGAGKYKQATSISEHDGDNDEEGQSFNFPDLTTPDSSPQIPKATVSGIDESSIPAAGKSLD